MKRVFIGHRGVGKTALLRRHQDYFPEFKHFDLDAEIEKTLNLKISDIFQIQGEEKFREIEHQVFQKIIDQNSEYVVSLGAGFVLTKPMPSDAEVIFVSRATDENGRIFLNRPRLNSNLNHLSEYQQRYQQRQGVFLEKANWIYHMPEGIETSNEIEKKILGSPYVEDAYYTLTEVDLKNIESVILKFKKIELRTDLIQIEQINDLLKSFTKTHWLVSIRSSIDESLLHSRESVDGDVQFLSNHHYSIVSSHADDISKGIKQLDQYSKSHLKLCPLVINFEDLILGYRWQQQDPSNRSFLPRSNIQGGWTWYRQLCKYKQKINFIKSFAPTNDQPSLYQWLVLPEKQPQAWAAVLGQPIYFSRSPLQHEGYFKERQSFFTSVHITAEEVEKYFDFFSELGLSYAAITSPLKEVVSQKLNIKNEFEAINTIILQNGIWLGANTDIDGFKYLATNIDLNKKIAVWGGGGTLNMLKAVLPKADFFSSQSGEIRDVNKVAKSGYDFLVWAAPRAEKTLFPSFNVGTVIDLNYAEHSMGLELAAVKNIPYVSGLDMFKVQAREQQLFWSKNECK